MVNAGGKGTRLNDQGVEKPLLDIGGKPVIERVIEALNQTDSIEEIFVSVSPHTKATADYLKSKNVRTICTSGEDFMRDIHLSLQNMTGRMVLICPSDLPLLSSDIVDELVRFHYENEDESTLALVAEEVLNEVGVKPSYTIEYEGSSWALSGVSIVDREKILQDVFLSESYYPTRYPELAVNVNTVQELGLARRLVRN